MQTQTTSLKSSLNPRLAGILIALIGALLMSFDPIFIRFSGVSGFDTAFLFGLFTAISMPFFIQFRDERGLLATLKESGVPVIYSGILMLGSASALVLSIKNTSIANTFVILSAAPALAAVFSRLFLGEVTQRATWIAIGFVMIGIGIVVSGSYETGNWFGDLLAVFAVTCVALNQTLLRKYQHVSRMASVGVGGLLLALVMFMLASPSSFSLETWLIMALMGLFTAPFGRVLSQVATRYITAAEVGMILMIEAVFAPLWAFGVFGEIPPSASLLGGGIILVTIFLYAVVASRPGRSSV
ncbi:DMT family transporter [Motiliproteus coralliicola]|uniref:DMT family transporter n=1 Tax=Motiliproteus coralliicola TaxID=2283196 RepID=A0A369WUN9_9GAMM|nr:DMT family transporter [Motiliproteus coralliicola]RDE25372.1 DMT family transporter [Motiliproteus coralliicola]